MVNRSFNVRLMASLLAVLAITHSAFAQDKPNHKRPRYKLYLVPPPGGGADSFSILGPPILHLLNSQGTLGNIGNTTVSDPFFGFVTHGDLSRNATSTELNALPPSETNISLPVSISDNGLTVGVSGNGRIDPLTGFPEFEAVFFFGSHPIDLGNLGGNVSGYYSVNNRGQIVGFALNTIPDPYGSFLMGCATVNCFPTGQQMRATLWELGRLHDLGTLGGNDAVAGIINDSGQIAGTSYTNTIPNQTTGWPSQDPFFWDRGKMVDIGNLGGTFAYANWMNERGQVVGLSTLAGDQVSHPFFWERGRLTDIGTFGGTQGEAKSINNAGEVVGDANFAGDLLHDGFFWSKGKLTDIGNLGVTSRAYAINSSGQVVGASTVTPGTVHAFLWEKGKGMVDLNDFIAPGSGLYLQSAYYINDRGQISGDAFLDDGHERAYLLTPCDDDHHPGDCRSDMFSADTVAGAAPSGVVRAAPTGDEHISSFADLRRQLQQRHRISGRPPVH